MTSAAELTSDKILLERFRRGADDAATALLIRYATRLRRLAENQMQPQLASRVDAEDIVQSVFRTFFRRAELGQYDLPDGDQLWRLLLVISLNKIRAIATKHRAAKRDIHATQPMLNDSSHSDTDGDEATDLSILRMTTDELLNDYPESQREAIQMRIAGYEIDDIVTKTGRSKRTIERTLQRFRQQLADLLKDDA